MDSKQIKVGDIVRVASHDVHVSLWQGAVHTPGKTVQHNGYHAVKVVAIFDDGMAEVEVGKFGDVDNVPVSTCTVIEPLDDVMTTVEVAQEFGIADATVRQAIERGYIQGRQSGATWLVRRADAAKRWGKGLSSYDENHHYIDQRACHWLAEANTAIEKGNTKRAEMCERKAQYWLDRLNRYEGKA